MFIYVYIARFLMLLQDERNPGTERNDYEEAPSCVNPTPMPVRIKEKYRNRMCTRLRCICLHSNAHPSLLHSHQPRLWRESPPSHLGHVGNVGCAKGTLPRRRAILTLHCRENLVPAGRSGDASRCHSHGGMLCLHRRVHLAWTLQFCSFLFCFPERHSCG